jgi:hypothetical protein
MLSKDLFAKLGPSAKRFQRAHHAVERPDTANV